MKMYDKHNTGPALRAGSALDGTSGEGCVKKVN